MLFWILCAAMVAMVGAAIMAPFLRGSKDQDSSSASYDLQVYRDQLREVDRDLQRGVIGADDATRLRTEIGRKVLDADRRMTDDTERNARRAGWIGALVVLAMVFGAAIWLYDREGVPGMPDLPLAERIAAAEASYANRPSQAEAQAAMPATPQPEIDDEYATLIEQLRSAVEATPDDPQGLALLATHEARLGNMQAAIAAQSHLIEVKADGATAADYTVLASLMTEAAGGLISPEAEQQIAHALQLDPSYPQALYMLGLLQAQNGRPDRTFPIWRGLLERGPPDAPWIAPIQATIRDLAWLAGQPDYVPPAAPAPAMPTLPGPDADMMSAAQDMTPEDRQQMITGMVAQLESRLATQGGSPEEWARLISSLGVLGNLDHARDIWAEAQSRFADQPQALATVRAGAESAGVAE